MKLCQILFGCWICEKTSIYG